MQDVYCQPVFYQTTGNTGGDYYNNPLPFGEGKGHVSAYDGNQIAVNEHRLVYFRQRMHLQSGFRMNQQKTEELVNEVY